MAEYTVWVPLGKEDGCYVMLPVDVETDSTTHDEIRELARLSAIKDGNVVQENGATLSWKIFDR